MFKFQHKGSCMSRKAMWLTNDIQQGVSITWYLDFSIYLPFSAGKTGADVKRKGVSKRYFFEQTSPRSFGICRGQHRTPSPVTLPDSFKQG